MASFSGTKQFEPLTLGVPCVELGIGMITQEEDGNRNDKPYFTILLSLTLF
jgi:hypothetical protein